MNKNIRIAGVLPHGGFDWEWKLERCEDQPEQFAVLVTHPGNSVVECAGYCWEEDDPEAYVREFAEAELF